MRKINVSSNVPPYNVISPSCIKYYKPLVKKKKKIINTDDIGTPSYNMLLDLLKCQVKLQIIILVILITMDLLVLHKQPQPAKV